ncbi:MAG: hypothetical protein ACXVEF_13055 [Polyangiales bacterium]
MSNIVRVCLLAFVSASVACGGGADETSSPPDPVGSESSAVASACPNKPPKQFHHCSTLDEICSYSAAGQCFRCALGISSTSKSLQWVTIPCT